MLGLFREWQEAEDEEELEAEGGDDWLLGDIDDDEQVDCYF